MVSEAKAQRAVDAVITRYKTSPILHYPYVAQTPDAYGQSRPGFGVATTLVGRAIHRPTKEAITVIGDGEVFEIAFLFSRLEMLRKFPSAPEGEWISSADQLSWQNRRYRILHVRPTGQLGETFSELIVLGETLVGTAV
jgi:hypothetical protein